MFESQKFPEPDEKPLFSRPRSRVKDLLAVSPSTIIGLLVTVCGWARTVRGGAVDRPIFVELNDGSCLGNLQITCLLEKADLEPEWYQKKDPIINIIH